MKTYYPNLLSRKKAMSLLNLSRKRLENYIIKNNVRTFKTNGGHNRYFRDDLIKHNNG